MLESVTLKDTLSLNEHQISFLNLQCLINPLPRELESIFSVVSFQSSDSEARPFLNLPSHYAAFRYLRCLHFSC